MSGYNEAFKTVAQINRVLVTLGITEQSFEPANEITDHEALDPLNYLRTVETHCAEVRDLITKRVTR